MSATRKMLDNLRCSEGNEGQGIWREYRLEEAKSYANMALVEQTKRLADATEKQVQQLKRIADVLESRKENAERWLKNPEDFLRDIDKGAT